MCVNGECGTAAEVERPWAAMPTNPSPTERERGREELQNGTGDENRVVIRWWWVEHINLMDYYAIADRLT